ncbi:erythromycin esterase family protein [Streptomyces sp. NBC_01142]|uniref:erythromycin esterase family protein n=1 Tax=Streptomyces sp. NBC_01142 TaxID=2975865 RepID=UPI0022557D26|nr:erythromycin esterase family protein [Streptomyces sp. NBC_01142]MCX4822006.1 erythromycin esterase family protein [Streptomyces sp. NBC_01142]
MYSHTRHRLRQLLLLALALGSLVVAGTARAQPSSGPPSDDPGRALARAARPLSDLRPLERMIGTAKIVGIGEATHNSREFFTTKHRVFGDLVERKGFTTYALEANWSTGLRLNDYVLHGKGDPRRIMREEFQNSYLIWHTREYLDLIRWMRQHNLRHPHHPVQFMGNDLGYAGPRLFDTVTAYVGQHYPALLPQIGRLYRESRPTGGVDATMKAYMARPLPERRALAKDVQRALALLERQRPGPDREKHAWMLQDARAIAQTGTEFSYDLTDPAEIGEAMRYRDRIMAENTVWWQRQTGHRMLLSAHNGHVGYESSNTAQYPKLQGAFLRDMIGDEYISAGFTFGQGSFNALDVTDPAEPIRRFEVGPPERGSNEHTLERVSRRDYYLDMRTAPAAARNWLGVVRQTRNIGNAWPAEEEPVRLAASYDVLIHLHRVTAADRL